MPLLSNALQWTAIASFSSLYLLFTGIWFIEAQSEIRAAVAGVALTVAVGLYYHRQTSRREATARLFTDRRTTLNNLSDLFLSQEGSEHELSFESNLLLSGSEATIKTWLDFRYRPPGKLNDPKGAASYLQDLENLLRNLRQDLGHVDHNLAPHALLDLLIGTSFRERLLERGFAGPADSAREPDTDRHSTLLHSQPANTLSRIRDSVTRVGTLLLGTLCFAAFIYDVSRVDASAKAVLLGYVGTVLAAIFYHQQVRARDAVARLYSGKRQAYSEFLDLFHKFNKSGSEMTDRRAQDMHAPLTKLLLAWAGPDVISAWWSTFGGNSGDSEDAASRTSALLIAIRRELGHPESRLPAEALSYLLPGAEETPSARRKSRGPGVG